ncbi:hypothetical protein CDEST_08301 [Colletotrichum destructivum]|uniref:Secreted protein n=1 Tax=Colletotrichum destructivum TaxID=34406 RepID=A0AAX4IJ01_9PEZI|nr:hypothetical protein CDEST_08301 [Colletotrichum destructivum]
MQDTQLVPRAHSDIRCLHFLCYVCFASPYCAVWNKIGTKDQKPLSHFSSRSYWPHVPFPTVPLTSSNVHVLRWRV